MPNAKSSGMSQSTKNRIILGAAVVIVIAILAVGVKFCADKYLKKPGTAAPSTTAAQQTTESQPLGNMDPLTGIYGLNENAVGKRPIAIVINNAPPARPQWGLCSPDIVIEGVTEAGIARMLWLYSDVNSIPKVGSLRSARHDFVEMAEGFDAIFVHWGGSIYAYQAMKDRKVDEIDGKVYSGSYFFRDKSRHVAIEHTGYTTGESLNKLINKRNIRSTIDSTYTSPFQFAPQDKPAVPNGDICKSASFVFSSAYTHEFRYNADKKLYYNYLNKKPMVEDGGKQMAVTNVILIYVSVKSMNDSAGCVDMDLQSGGKGVYISQGKSQEITWEKGAAKEPLKLHTLTGEKLTLNAGKSYIGLVPTSQKSKTVLVGAGESATN